MFPGPTALMPETRCPMPLSKTGNILPVPNRNRKKTIARHRHRNFPTGNVPPVDPILLWAVDFCGSFCLQISTQAI